MSAGFSLSYDNKWQALSVCMNYLTENKKKKPWAPIMMGLKAELQSKEANVLTIKTTTQMNLSLTEVPQIAKELKLIHLKISYKIPHHFHPNERPSQKRTVQCLGHLCSRLL